MDVERDAGGRGQQAEAVSPGLRRLPVVFFPDGTLARGARRPGPGGEARAADNGRAAVLRPAHCRRRTDRPRGGGVRRIGRSSHGAVRARDHRRAGGHERGHRELPRLPQRPVGRRPGTAGDGPGQALRRRGADRAARSRRSGRTGRTASPPWTTAASSAATRSCWRPGWRCGGWRCPGIEPLTGAGVFYGAALTEAAACRGKDVLIVGGANSAGQAALSFARYARKVTILVRGASLTESMSQYLVDRITDTANIEVLPHAEVAAAHGTDQPGSRGRGLRRRPGRRAGSKRRPCSSSSARRRRSDIASGLVERDPGGFILTGPDLRATAACRGPGRWSATPSCWRPAAPASLPRGTCDSARPSAWRRRSGRGPPLSAWCTSTWRQYEHDRRRAAGRGSTFRRRSLSPA